MKVFSLTTELDQLLPEMEFTRKPDDAELVILGTSRLSLLDFPNARGVFRTGVGTDNIDQQALNERHVALGLPSDKTRTIIYDETAAFSTHLILSALFRGAGDFASWQRESRPHIRTRQVLLIGCGNIGSRVRQSLENMVKLLVHDPVVEDSVDIGEAIGVADVISLHIPPVGNNVGFVGESFLSKIKSGASIVNTGRGALIDDTALARELQAKRLFAYLDVFVEEPYDGPLTEYVGRNLFATPHIASTSSLFFDSMADDFRDFHRGFSQ